MAYDAMKELETVLNYYNSDPLQQRFSALVSGETNSGKTHLFRTARLPVHIDSFDPGGTKCLLADPSWPENDPRRITSLHTKENPIGQIFADTRWELEDPFDPKVFNEWKRATDIRIQIDYYSKFGTLGLDSGTTWGKAIMNSVLDARNAAGTIPEHRKDYNPQKVEMENYVNKLMRVPCDFIMTAHLEDISKLISVDRSTGVRYEETKTRIMVTGKAVITLPLLFDEIYVIQTNDSRGGQPKRNLLIDSTGQFLARSRLKREGGNLSVTEPPDIKALLKKAGFSTEDKPRLEIN